MFVAQDNTCHAYFCTCMRSFSSSLSHRTSHTKGCIQDKFHNCRNKNTNQQECAKMLFFQTIVFETCRNYISISEHHLNPLQ